MPSTARRPQSWPTAPWWRGNVTFRLWAPTAKSVKLALFDEQHKSLGERAMTLDEASGGWSVQGAAILSANTTATISGLSPGQPQLESYQVTDPTP